MTQRTMTSALAALALLATTAVADADSAFQAAMANGGQRLDADAIAERIAGKTVTFRSADGAKTFLVYYGEGNEAAGRLLGGEWSDTGLYAITDADTICLSWAKSDRPRMRCMHVVLIDGKLHKFGADGSLSGTISAVEEGNIL